MTTTSTAGSDGAMRWSIGRAVGSASELHGRPFEPPVVRAIHVLEVDRPALVLGSAQRDDVVDPEAAARLGVEVVHRRSGGGAVLLRPGEVVWVDVELPREDPLWDDDIGRATWWLGDAWARALGSLGVGDPVVHRGGLVRTPGSDLVCFAGLGPGEVTVAGAKAVGISQRRTRAGARFQCAVPLAWDAPAVAALLPAARAVEVGVHVVDAPAAGIVDALVARLPA